MINNITLKTLAGVHTDDLKNEYKIKNIKESKGITLIALVITIIILLILAGITISSLSRENGLLKKIQNASEVNSEATAREKLELVLLSMQSDKAKKLEEYNENEYIDKNLNENNMEVSGDIVTVDGWQFKINRSTPEIEKNLGKLTKEAMLLPTITKFNIEKSKNNIIVSLKIRNEENSKITYIIRKEGEESDLEKIENETNLQHTFSNLDLGKYIIIVNTENEYGTDNATKMVEVTISIEFDEINKELWVGAERDIKYSITPENASKDNLKWESSNPDIVQIDENGKLTALKLGTSVITGTLNGTTSTCTIEVKNNIFEDIAKSGKTIEELGMNISSSGCHVWKFNPSDMKGICGGSWSGICNWSWKFTVPKDMFNGKSSITTIWNLYVGNEKWNYSTSNGIIEVIYEDGEKEDVQVNYTLPLYTCEWSEFVLKYTFKNKPIQTITFKAFGLDNDWGSSYATLEAILY